MKLQHMTVIFIIIIFPITLVLSLYINTQIDIIQQREVYSAALLTATNDAMTAYELNTMNDEYADNSGSKKRDVQAAINTFFNSFTSQSSLSGYKAEDLQPYIPAIIFTGYDGYYIYSPTDEIKRYTKEDEKNDPSHIEGMVIDGNTKETLYSLKPFVYYSARYKSGTNTDVVISYTLDNYITIYGELNGNYVSKSGYIVSNYYEVDENETYSETVFTEESYIKDKNTDRLWDANLNRYVTYNGYEINGAADGTIPAPPNRETTKQITKITTSYEYYEMDGTIRKIYKAESSFGDNVFFFISLNKARTYITFNDTEHTSYNLINGDASYSCSKVTAKEYYSSRIDLTSDEFKGLTYIKASDIIDLNGNKASDITETNNIYYQFKNDNTKIFEGTNLELQGSTFWEHKQKVIKASIQNNIQLALNNYAKNSTHQLKIPAFTEQQWSTILNNISIIAFLQDVPIKNSFYNNYAISTSSGNKDYVSDGGMYFIAKETNTYHKINCRVLAQQIKDGIVNANNIEGYRAIEFTRSYINPDNGGQHNYYKHVGADNTPILACYDCIISSNAPNLYTSDDYNINFGVSTDYGGTDRLNELKKKYYTYIEMAKLTQYKSTNILE